MSLKILTAFVMKLFFLAFVVGGASAFLATPLNTSDPDVINILCPDQMDGATRDHEWITREAIRRNIRRFFTAHPPRPDFFVPSEATLTELYHAYYGSTSSPTRFIKAVNSIAASNVKADSSAQLRYDPAIQADGESLEELQATLIARYPQILTSILHDESYSAARALLGTSYHSIQKFYSHSTWVEQGNVGILEGLGIPGSDLGNLAGESDNVCTSCANPQGECSANVILGSGLSTGYYEYEDEVGASFLIPKPPTGGKCSHGGALDASASQPAEGGINKDTTSPCFSPHFYLHSYAAEMAVEATDHYLNVILDAVGEEKYRRLFDLYFGSALSICIDTTGSMGDDIEAVVDQVEQIVAHSTVELYILVPFNDPEVGPLISTSDAQVFLDAVRSLYAHGGGDGPEMFWGGLQMALKATPDYGSLFCFTDADGKDGELMEGLISLAQQKHVKVTVILSDIYKKSEQTDEGGDTKLVTSVEEYQRLADSTGGLLISTDKFDVSDIVAIIGEGVETSTVTLESLAEMKGSLSVSLPIDDSILDFEVRITGVLSQAMLFDITGTAYDLTDKGALEATPGVEVISHTGTFLAVRFLSPRHGVWSLSVSASVDYALAVSATSSLDFLGEFALLDPKVCECVWSAEGNVFSKFRSLGGVNSLIFGSLFELVFAGIGMMKWLSAAVVLLAVTSVQPQCFSENDDLSIPPSNDLSGIADFGLELFKEIFPYNSSSNFFFSPYSVWNALTLAYFGSSGNTQAELERVLRVEDKVTTLKNWRTLEFLYDMRQTNNSDYTFKVANRAYFDSTVNLTGCVGDILTNELQVVDFTKTEEAAGTINNFVSNTTKGRIPSLVEAKDLINAKMVLANAAFFKGTWLYQFKKSATRPHLFYSSQNDYTFVDMMTQKGNFRHGVSEELGAHILELPYTGEAISMYILLPPFISGEQGFNAMVENLNATTLHYAIDDMWRLEVEVVIPKFKLEQMVGDELMESLSRMGISDLFTPGAADLSSFADDTDLSVGRSIHKAFVEVSEEGTEAAAATAFISLRIARPVGPEKFECNHPFLFVIYDNLTKNILFMGAYKNPKA